MRRVALVVATRGGLVLFGKRNDNGRWTLPGGHLEEGEDPKAGALRELKEETGLEPVGEMRLLDSRSTNGLVIHTFECEVDGAPTGVDDPDGECSVWGFFDIKDGVPKTMAENLAGPKDEEKNVVKDVYGVDLEKAEPLAKMALIHDDPSKPATVYRVQDEAGTGPYAIDEHRNTDVHLAAQRRRLPVPLRHLNTDKDPQPSPGRDFDDEEWGSNPEVNNRGLLFGFEKPEHATDWFGGANMEDMAAHGFKLVPTLARKVYRSKSGKQVLFQPHEEELAKAEPDSGEQPDTWYHLTDNPNFALDPEYAPADNSMSIVDRGGRKGIYLAKDPEKWVNGHNYVRPYLAEFHVHPSVKDQPGVHGRWGGEMFVPAEHFGQVSLNRVIPLDAHAREHYGDHGWIESHHGTEFDTNNPIKGPEYGKPYTPSPLRGYKYAGPDVRQMTPEQHEQHKTRWHSYMKENRGIDMDAPAEDDLEKADINPVPGRIVDYTHRTWPNLQDAGYTLTVRHEPSTSSLHADVRQHGKHVGSMVAEYQHPGAIGPAGHDLKDEELVENAHQALKHRAGTLAAEIEPPTLEGALTGLVDQDKLQKMAIADIKRGAVTQPPAEANMQVTPGKWHNYNHTLSPAHRAAGYRLYVHHIPGPQPKRRDVINAHLFHRGQDVGGVEGEIEAGANQLQVDSNLMPAHQGKGLGRAMYEAVYAHALHNGAKGVVGFNPSSQAQAVHESLARRHGLKYKLKWGDFDYNNPEESGSEYAYKLKSELPMAKSEEHDEVDRLLLHADPTERRLALKLDSVAERHLIRALQSDDKDVRRAAFRHPHFSKHAMNALMRMPDREDLQHKALGRDDVTPEHLEALYDTHKDRPTHEKAAILHAIAHHGALGPKLIERMFADGNGVPLVENLKTPTHIAHQLIEQHLLDPDNDLGRSMARRALQRPDVDPGLVARAFKEGLPDVRLAAAGAPQLGPQLITDALTNGQLPAHDGDAHIRLALLARPDATTEHHRLATRDRNNLVREKAARHLQPETMKKFEVEVGQWLGESLAKATKPVHFAGLARASSQKGRDMVDHAPELTAHPAEHGADVQAYRHAILESPKVVEREKHANRDNGITKKVIYQVPATHPTHGGIRYMLKPYHERIPNRWDHLGKHHHLGWAEMTNQALYHAGGIGHLHQNVHVAEHNMGGDLPKEPALVVKMEPGMDVIHHALTAWKHATPQVKADAQKIALMDFLTNNNDRHSGNVLINAPKRAPLSEGGHILPDAYDRIMAIDHGRSFQYARSLRTPIYRKDQDDELDDSLNEYVRGSGLEQLAPLEDTRLPPYERDVEARRRWAPTFDWWGQNSDKIKGAWAKRLEQIKDPAVREHLDRNFKERTRHLDDIARWGIGNFGSKWHSTPVRIYRPGEEE